MISIIIATKNRPDHLKRCIRSIGKNSYKNFEVIIADQSSDEKTKRLIKTYNNQKIKYIQLSNSGKTKAVNQAIRFSRGEILSFIDDDNIVNPDWLQVINAYFSKNPKIDGVFGKILPYKPSARANRICPSVFLLQKPAIVTDPYVIHHQSLGLGSNMSLKKQMLDRIGYFMEWLGPGNFGFCGGEDGELIHRMLLNRAVLAYDPRACVYHNRWLSYNDHRALQAGYTGGEIAYSFYYWLKGDRKMSSVVDQLIHQRIGASGLRGAMKKLNLNIFFRELKYILWETLSILKGITVALIVFTMSHKKEINALNT